MHTSRLLYTGTQARNPSLAIYKWLLNLKEALYDKDFAYEVQLVKFEDAVATAYTTTTTPPCKRPRHVLPLADSTASLIQQRTSQMVALMNASYRPNG